MLFSRSTRVRKMPARLPMLALLSAFVAVFLMVSPGQAADADAETRQATSSEQQQPTVQLAILLDTSNSMDGLIGQARTQLWRIVNEFSRHKLGGQEPRLEVALFEYGNDGLPASEGHVRLVTPLTDDLDKVSEALFGLTTNGGSEYCGHVIQDAVERLTWSDKPRDIRAIFIAGNEPFTQGGVDYRKACKVAADQGITISTIFCGDKQEGIATKWEHGAQLADGTYMAINQDRAVATIAAPQDKRLAELSVKLNKTYIGYGQAGQEGQQRQAQQDAAAAQAAPAAAANRAVAKASKQYNAATWDLVDAVKKGKADLEAMPAEELPEPMRQMSPEERKAYVAKMEAERKQIQEEIRQLSDARRDYVAKERARLAAEQPAAEASFDEAVIEAVEAQVEGR